MLADRRVVAVGAGAARADPARRRDERVVQVALEEGARWTDCDGPPRRSRARDDSARRAPPRPTRGRGGRPPRERPRRPSRSTREPGADRTGGDGDAETAPAPRASAALARAEPRRGRSRSRRASPTRLRRSGRPWPSTAIGSPSPRTISLTRVLDRLGRERDRRPDRVEVELGEPVVGAPGHHLVGELALRVEQRVDPLLDRRGTDEGRDEDGLPLAETVDAVGGLLLDRGVPPAVEVDDVVRGGKVESPAAGAQRDDEHGRLRLRLEAPDELVSGLWRTGRRGRTRQTGRVAPRGAGRAGEARILGEHERFVVGRYELSSSTSRSSFPDRPSSARPVGTTSSGWLHSCFSCPSIARTAPRLSKPSRAARCAASSGRPWRGRGSPARRSGCTRPSRS